MTKPPNQPARLRESAPPDSVLARGLAAAQERGPSDEQAAALERQLFYALGASVVVGAAVKAGAASAKAATSATMGGAIPALALKVALVVAVATGGSAMTVRMLRHHEPAPFATGAAMPAPRPLAEIGIDDVQAPVAARADDVAPHREPVRHAPREAQPAAGPRHRERTAIDPLHAELRLIEAARAAAPYQPERALQLGLTHERNFPRGVMREEREAIIISALISIGREDEARARQVTFVRLYPSSPYTAQLRDRLRARTTP